jgi:hypothetical protein
MRSQLRQAPRYLFHLVNGDGWSSSACPPPRSVAGARARPPGMPYGTRYFARAETSTSANASAAHPRGRGALATPEGLPIVIDDAQVGSLLEYIQADILLHCLISMHGVGRKASAPPSVPRYSARLWNRCFYEGTTCSAITPCVPCLPAAQRLFLQPLWAARYLVLECLSGRCFLRR